MQTAFNANEPVRVYVGTDRSQLLAVKVLEHSIKRHTELDVEVHPMLDLDLPEPNDPRQGKRTGFSFARFAIPQLAGFKGRAVYMDADMLVFKDIAELWDLPFDTAKVIIQDDIPDVTQAIEKAGAPKKRIKQCAVMLLDCGRLKWDPVKIINGLNGKYSYEELMYHLCILKEREIKYTLPYQWNSLEHFDESTRLLHYTDMYTQPWVFTENKHGYLWMREVRLMLENGSLSWEELERDVKLGYFRPSLLLELKMPECGEKPLPEETITQLNEYDKSTAFVKHKEVYDAKRIRKKAIKEFEENTTANNAGWRLLWFKLKAKIQSITH